MIGNWEEKILVENVWIFPVLYIHSTSIMYRFKWFNPPFSYKNIISLFALQNIYD